MPADDFESKVWRLWQAGTRYHWTWRCPECGERFVPRFECLGFEGKGDEARTTPARARETAHIVCPRHGCILTEADKPEMNASGAYVAPGQRIEADDTITGEPPESDTESFWVSGLCSPFRSIGDRAAAYVEAVQSGDGSNVQTVINAGFGECYADVPLNAPRVEAIKAKRVPYAMGDVPREVMRLVAGIDVQKREIFYVVRGFGARGASWLIQAEKLNGLTDGEDVWDDLADALLTPYGGLRIEKAFIDSGFRPDKPDAGDAHRVYAFARRYDWLVVPTKGYQTRSSPLTIRKHEVDTHGKAARFSVDLAALDSDFFKSLVMSRVQTPSGGLGRGICRTTSRISTVGTWSRRSARSRAANRSGSRSPGTTTTSTARPWRRPPATCSTSSASPRGRCATGTKPRPRRSQRAGTMPTRPLWRRPAAGRHRLCAPPRPGTRPRRSSPRSPSATPSRPAWRPGRAASTTGDDDDLHGPTDQAGRDDARGVRGPAAGQGVGVVGLVARVHARRGEPDLPRLASDAARPGRRGPRRVGAGRGRAVDVIHNSGWITGAIDQAVANTVGAGLRPRLMPDAAALGWTEDEATDWAARVEGRFLGLWANNPYECDIEGRRTFGQMQAAGYRSWFGPGEIVSECAWKRRPGATYGTKVRMIPAHRLSQRTSNPRLVQGVQMDADWMPISYWFWRRGAPVGAEQEIEIEARDRYGRPRIVHVFDGVPGQYRGISPWSRRSRPPGGSSSSPRRS